MAETKTSSTPAEPATDPVVRWWNTPRGNLVAMAILVAVSLTLLFSNISRLGIWEPWEANEILVATEYAERGEPSAADNPQAPSWNWAVPTSKKRPVERPLLKTWILANAVGEHEAKSEVEIGELEASARVPIAILVLALALASFLFIRRYYGTWPALFTSVVFASVPAIYLGVHNLASEMLFVVTTSFALMAFVQMTYGLKRHRLLWGFCFGFWMALAFLDQRLLGLYLPLLVIAAFAVTELMVAPLRDDEASTMKLGRAEILSAAAALVAAGGVGVWGWTRSAGYEDGLFMPHVLQWMAVLIVPLLCASGLLLARRTRPGRALFGAGGLLAAIVTVVPVVLVASAYGDANPVLLKDGEVVGKIPVLQYLLENHVFERSLVQEHITFDVWLRQIGFSLLPWVALLPLAFAYLGRAAQPRDEDGDSRELSEPRFALMRFFLVWMVFAAIAVGAATAYGHYFYPAYLPVAAAIGLAMTDVSFWRRLRTRPLMLYALGFVAIAIVMMLGKDLERFPSRFVEVYVTLQREFKLAEDFSFGRLFKTLKYGWMLLLAVYFFGLVSWAALTWRELRELPARIRRWRARDKDAASPEAPVDDAVAPFIARAREKEAFRAGEGVVARAARFFETPATYGLVLVAAFVASALLMLFVFVPQLTNHVSQRGVFETYTRLADEGEPLYRYQVSSRDNSVYLADIEAIRGHNELAEKFEQDERFFAVIPRDKLAAINYEIRRRFKKNLAVLDARSSRLLLVSNQLEEGEQDHSFVADKIVEGEPKVRFPVQFTTADGELKHPVFNGQLEMLGYDLDREPDADGLVTYKWGETAVITYYFRVLKRVPSNQKIFLHVDFPGNRINGDHYPNDGEFPTNYWLPGDVVKSVHHLEIDTYSSPGAYTMWFGFFLGSRRMEVEPREAHDGQNRVNIGRIRVSSGL